MKHLPIAAWNLFLFLTAFTLIPACSKDEHSDDKPDMVVISGTGDINPKLDEFRQLLGNQLNTAPGATSGRREINWDGVSEQMLNTKLPENFFNQTAAGSSMMNQRGLIYSPGGNFQVSKTGFKEVNVAASNEFSNFSGDKSFANISSKLWEAGFQVAGKNEPATVKGFGIVFADVDLAASTSLEFFSDDKSLGKFFVPAKKGSNFSFLGVYFKHEKITHVRVAHDGQLDSGLDDISHNGPTDHVIMDNFLYSEPIKKQ
jgi:hypothetical protein